MKKKHLKKSTFLKIVGASIGVSVLIGSVAATAVSCSQNKTDNTNQPVNVNGSIQNNNSKDFMSSNNAYTTITTPQMIRDVLATSNGQAALQKTYAQYAVYEWFKNSNNALVQSAFQQQINEAQKSYNAKYNSYKKQGGNWQDKFQQQVLDPAGGSEQSWIYQQVSSNLINQFISFVMPSNFLQSYLSLQSGSTITPLSGSSISLNTINDPSNVNGGFSVSVGSNGNPIIHWNASNIQTNNFVIAPSSSDSSSNSNSINKGYADFINFAFNQWVKQTLPVLSPAVLYKNSANPNESGLFNSYFFGSNLTANGSYNFQYFTPSSGNLQVDSTTDLYNQFLNGLQNNFWNNDYVQAATGGAINIPKNLTQDTSTKLVTNISSAFTTYVAPFASAVTYKLSNLIYGNGTTGTGNALDPNVPVASSFFTGNSSDSTQTIMGNFLIFNPSSGKVTTPAGGIIFPYSSVNSILAFSDAYAGVVGTKDSVDILNSPFIMTRDQFGVHIIGIDRYYAMQQALIHLGNSATPAQKMQAIYTVMRNTVLWRAAQDMKGGSNNLNLESTLQKWVSDNIDSLILSYLGYNLDPNNSSAFVPSGQDLQANIKNNLFGSQWQKSTTWEKTFTNNFSSGTQANNNLLGLFNAINNINIVANDKTYISNVSSKMYSQQSSYNDTVNPKTWASYALAGVLPYTRNPFTGNYDSLDAIVLNNLPILNQMQPSSINLSLIKGPFIPTYIQNIIANNSISAAPIAKLWYAQSLYNENYANLLNNYLANVSPASSSSSYWSSSQFFANSGQTVIGSHSYVLVDNLLVNLAVQQAQENSVITNVVQNALNNAQLQNFYNFKQNQLLGYNPNLASESFNSSSITSLSSLNEWITYWLQNAINSQYNINNFTSLTNLYQAGNWTSFAQVQQIANMLANQNFYSNLINVPNASVGSSNPSAQYLNFSSNVNFLKFLETLQWLLGWDSTTKTYTFTNLISQLNDMVKDNQIAYIAWQFQNTNKFNVYKNTNNINFSDPVPPSTNDAPSGQAYGLTGSLNSYQNDINNAIYYDGQFKPNPLYLTHLTPYSFQGAQNMTKAFGSGDNYFAYSWSGSSETSEPIETLAYNSTFVTSDFTHYFNVAPIGNNDFNSTGFLGFQSNSSNSVVSSLPSSAYNSSIFGNNISNPSDNYVGALYQYQSAQNLKQDISNSQSSSQLENYINVINQCGFNFSSQASQALTDALNGYSTKNGQQIPLTFSQRKTMILNDVLPLIPSQAFTPLTNSFLWNKQSSVSTTLFQSSSQNQSAIYNEYVVTEFSSADVNNLVTYFNGSNSIKALNTSSTGLLRSNPQAFFDAVVLLAQNSNVQTLASQAITTNQQSSNNQITVYDNRVAQALGQQIVKNWDDFKDSN